MPKTVNYTAELTQKIIDDYQNGTSVQSIADSIGKSLQSVRSKLVREGVYIAQEKKSKSNKPKEPTKKELLNVLESQLVCLVQLKIQSLIWLSSLENNQWGIYSPTF